MDPESISIVTICDGGVPECALFEADGGKWKLDAVLTIKAWLEDQHLNIPVIA